MDNTSNRAITEFNLKHGRTVMSRRVEIYVQEEEMTCVKISNIFRL